jgi:hypothetical protein
MKIKPKDYVVVEVKPGKNRLAKVKTVDDDILNVVYTANQHVQDLRQAEEVQRTSIILNLGPEPKPGSVYGCSTEAFTVALLPIPISARSIGCTSRKSRWLNRCTPLSTSCSRS